MKTNIDHKDKHITIISDSKESTSDFMEVVNNTLKGLEGNDWTVSTASNPADTLFTDPETFKVPSTNYPYPNGQIPREFYTTTNGVEEGVYPSSVKPLMS